jgi:hypothetical protein
LKNNDHQGGIMKVEKFVINVLILGVKCRAHDSCCCCYSTACAPGMNNCSIACHSYSFSNAAATRSLSFICLSIDYLLICLSSSMKMSNLNWFCGRIIFNFARMARPIRWALIDVGDAGRNTTVIVIGQPNFCLVGHASTQNDKKSIQKWI